MWPLLACSVLGLAIVLERSIVLLWLGVSFASFREQLKEHVLNGSLEETNRWLLGKRHPLAKVSSVYLGQLENSTTSSEEIVEREASQQVVRMERRINLLGMISHIAPLLGLLGTVAGLVTAFHQIEIRGGQVNPSDLASGIMEALLTTVFGLTIALPCLAAYHWLEHRVNTVALQMEWMIAYLNEWLGGKTEIQEKTRNPKHVIFHKNLAEGRNEPQNFEQGTAE